MQQTNKECVGSTEGKAFSKNRLRREKGFLENLCRVSSLSGTLGIALSVQALFFESLDFSI